MAISANDLFGTNCPSYEKASQRRELDASLAKAGTHAAWGIGAKFRLLVATALIAWTLIATALIAGTPPAFAAESQAASHTGLDAALLRTRPNVLAVVSPNANNQIAGIGTARLKNTAYLTQRGAGGFGASVTQAGGAGNNAGVIQN